MSVDKTLLELVKKSVKEAMEKKANADAFVPMPGGQPPMDPAMGGDPSMMDPAMMGGDPMAGGMPPMDPAMMGGDPMAGGMPPMDPAMMGGDPMAGGMPPAPPELPMDPVQLVSTVIAPMVRDAVAQAINDAAVDIKKKKTEGDAPAAPAGDPMAAGGMPPIDPAMMEAMMMGGGGMPPMDPAAAIGGMPAEGMVGLGGAPVDPMAMPKMGSENKKTASAKDLFLERIRQLKNLTK